MKRRRLRRSIPFGSNNFLSVLEGMEGGFAIFAGIVIGLSFEGVNRELLLLTATISIVVNAINASAVRFSTEHYLDELDGHEKRSWFKAYFIPALIEFVAYLVVSLISLLPLLWVASLTTAILLSVIITTIILFCAGYYRGALLSRHHAVRDGIETAGLGLLIITAGGVSGWLISTFIV